METTRRTFAKAVTWQISGLFMMTLITFTITGSIAEGGLVAVAGAVFGVLAFILHEKLWARIKWGREVSPDKA